MPDTITFFEGFSATIPAGGQTDVVTRTISTDTYFTWATGATLAPNVDINPWYVASGAVDGGGLIVTTAGTSYTQITLTNVNIANTFNSGAPGETAYPDNFVLLTEELPAGLSLKIVNTGAVDVTISDFTLSAITRPNRSPLPDYTSSWSGEPAEVLSGAFSVSDCLDITDRLPTGGISADLLMPDAVGGGIGTEDDVSVTAVSIPDPMPLFYESFWSGIPITIDRGLGPADEFAGQVFLAFWDAAGVYLGLRALSTTFVDTTGFVLILPIGTTLLPTTPAYWAAFAYLELPIIDFHGADLGVHTATCSVSVNFWVAYPVNRTVQAYGSIRWHSFMIIAAGLSGRGTRSFALVLT